jgi:hypothetical protein
LRKRYRYAHTLLEEAGNLMLAGRPMTTLPKLATVPLLIVDYLGMTAGTLPHSVITELHSLSTRNGRLSNRRARFRSEQNKGRLD